MGDKHHQQQDHDGNQGQSTVIKNPANNLRFTFLPVADFGAVFDAHLVRVLEVVEKLMGVGVPIFGIPLQGPV